MYNHNFYKEGNKNASCMKNKPIYLANMVFLTICLLNKNVLIKYWSCLYCFCGTSDKFHDDKFHWRDVLTLILTKWATWIFLVTNLNKSGKKHPLPDKPMTITVCALFLQPMIDYTMNLLAVLWVVCWENLRDNQFNR